MGWLEPPICHQPSSHTERNTRMCQQNNTQLPNKGHSPKNTRRNLQDSTIQRSTHTPAIFSISQCNTMLSHLISTQHTHIPDRQSFASPSKRPLQGGAVRGRYTHLLLVRRPPTPGPAPRKPLLAQPSNNSRKNTTAVRQPETLLPHEAT
jgi:hypothetical protein